MDLALLTNAKRSLICYDGGNTTAPAKRSIRTLFHPSLTVLAVASVKDARRYDVIPRDSFNVSSAGWGA